MKKTNKKKIEKKPEQKVSTAPPKVLCWLDRHINTIIYLAVLIVLWGYIGLNWEKCISMQFFSQFDGNNILFLVGIILVVLPLYDIEGKGFKLHRRGTKDTMEQLQKIEMNHQLEERKTETENTRKRTLDTVDSGGKGE